MAHIVCPAAVWHTVAPFMKYEIDKRVAAAVDVLSSRIERFPSAPRRDSKKRSLCGVRSWEGQGGALWDYE